MSSPFFVEKKWPVGPNLICRIHLMESFSARFLAHSLCQNHHDIFSP